MAAQYFQTKIKTSYMTFKALKTQIPRSHPGLASASSLHPPASGTPIIPTQTGFTCSSPLLAHKAPHHLDYISLCPPLLHNATLLPVSVRTPFVQPSLVWDPLILPHHQLYHPNVSAFTASSSITMFRIFCIILFSLYCFV